MTRFKPKKRIGKSIALCILFAVLSAAAATAGHIFRIRVLYAVAFCFISIMLYILALYIVTGVEYVLKDGVLYIYRLTPGKKRTVFDLDTVYISDVITYNEAKKLIRSAGKPDRRFFCTAGAKRRDTAVIVYGAKPRCMLYIAYDGVFVGALRSHIRCDV